MTSPSATLRRFFSAAAFCLGASLSPCSAQEPPPPPGPTPPANDSCASATPIDNAGLPFAASLAEATSSFNVNFGKQGVSNGPDVWYDFTAAGGASGLYEFTLSPGDAGDDLAFLFVDFQDCGVLNGLGGANDGGPGSPEVLSFAFADGERITFMVRGFGTADDGPFAMALTFTPGASVENWEAY